MTTGFRQRLLQLHLCAGLTVGLVLLAIALSGAAMLFRPQLDPVVNRELFAVAGGAERATLDVVAAQALAAHPGSAPVRLRYWSAGDRPSVLRCANHDQIYVDPGTGRVLGMQNRYRGFFGRAEDIHRFLGLGPSVGKAIGGAAVLTFVFVILSGFVLWVPPAWRALRSALLPNLRLAGRARLLHAHKLVGGYAGLVVLFSALTGLPHAYDWYEHLVYRVAGSPPPEAPPVAAAPAAAERLPMAEWARRIEALSGPYHSAEVFFPKPGQSVVQAWYVTADAPHVHARSYVYLDAVTGEVLRHEPYATSSAGHKLYYWMLALHLGQAGGPGWQLVLLGGCLSVPVLAVTGLLSYLRRRRGHRPAA
ncbi:MAG: PepSY domain-containing protein [Opitutaceae bacterium]|nr:PepSY domain-containing protein [Opitutaceae bacterium]